VEDEAALMREYPAYGRTIAAHIVRGMKPICVGVLLSSTWWYFDQAPKVCIRPDEWRRGRYEFGFLRGMHVVAVSGLDCTATMLGEMLLELMMAGPSLLWIWNADGSKIYDEEWADSLAHYVHQLTGGRVSYQVAKHAAGVMAAAQADASRRWTAEYERIMARSAEDALRFYDRSEQAKGRVRELFASPERETSDAPAA
jgi:hypothetical protein